jgi:glycosyltransferase involved in cell wall biosynthesis
MELRGRIVLIDDASSDNTPELIAASVGALCTRAPVAIELYRYDRSRFETRCDWFGFKLAKTKYVLEVQADMQLHDRGFDKRLVSCMDHHTDLIAVSGRGVVPLKESLDYYKTTAGSDRSRGNSLPKHMLLTLLSRVNAHMGIPYRFLQAGRPLRRLHEVPPSAKDFDSSGSAGMIANADLREHFFPIGSRRVWLGETVMRGPLLVDRVKYELIGGFDVSSFFQGFDDQDLILRGRIAGYACGYSPVAFSSPDEDGTTRKPRSWKSEVDILRELLRISRSRRSSALSLYAEGLITPPEARVEVRRF